MTAVRPAPGPRAAARGRRRAAREQRHPILNRELSWLEFNARVLHEAGDERNPLLDRVRSLFFFANNLDEFFQVRVSGLRRQELSGSQAVSADGRTAADQLDAIRARVLVLMAQQGAIFATLRGELAAEGIEILDYDDVS
jgi:polyphosphate kinase